MDMRAISHASLPTDNELESKVEERTAELIKLNEQLRREILEYQQADKEVRFLQRMTQAISESSDFQSALEVALKKICKLTDWKFGEAWIPNFNGTMLKCSPAWYGSDQNLEKFRKLSEGFTFAPGAGLPGRVWASKQSEWINDVSTQEETVFLRQQFVKEVGFKAGVGIPIIDNNQVLAVLVFFMFEPCEEDKRLIEIISTVATQLGSLLQRKRAEEAQQESKNRLYAVLDNSTAIIYVKDAYGRYLLINRCFTNLFGFELEELKCKTDYDIFPHDLADTYRANDQKVLEAGTAIESEEVVFHENGLHTYLSLKFPLYNPAGVIYAVCGISTDISERKRAEEALRSSYATNRALLNAIPDSMFRIRGDGIFVNFKAAKENNLPIYRNEFLGKHLYEVLPSEVAEPTMNCVQRALKTGEVQVLEFQFLVNNNLRDYEARIVVSAENEVMAIIRDITERKKAEVDIRSSLEKQKELGELKTRFVSMTSHEFRTPLTTILSSTELLEKYNKKLSDEKKIQHLHRIKVSVKHMTQLLNNVLLIGKAEAGKLQFHPIAMDLPKFCRDLVDELQLSSSDNHTIAFCQQGEYTTAYLDDKLLLYIFTNLLSNAIKYSPEGGNVNFDLIFQPEKVIFQVQDQGIGIPAAEQQQLFNSFHRASNVGTISGTGLGLAIVKKAVDLHQGEIAVKSEVGVGTTFIVTLPLTKTGIDN